MNYDGKIATTGDFVAADQLQDESDVPMHRPRSQRWWWIGAAVLLVLVGGGLWAMMHHAATPAAGAANAAQTPVVSVVEPGRTSVAGAIQATGSLGARREMPVGSVGEGGQVRAVLVDAGDWVKQGQVLAVIDRSVQSQQVASQSAQVQVAQADARIAQSNLDRALKLVDRGFISKADVDQLTATRDAASARVKVASATLGQLQAQTARLNIVAPAAGLVLRRQVEPGQVVSGGSGVLFSIAKDGQLEMLANLDEADLAKVAVGVPADVTPAGAPRSYHGEVWQVSPVIDPNSRQGQARIALTYAPGLRPGGFATAVINGGNLSAPLLPESAIQNDDKGSFVYIVDGQDKVQRRAIRTGLVTAQGITITQGLNGTEKVVLRAGGFLNPGDKVRPKSVRDDTRPGA
ncbi:efflux RND transporter periplasmic adaptor subunit [Novosphingobium sp. 9]|uniref:efflux RND transporter periplasmic adaptor subunit n=1 Tax=Novosphingobium sp. 9 TaxID=2025349 RepID=UPI0021B62271|nr:efflux RND transporter periplasmic adaptor subunit [Novosphingobium sp. 9]